MITLKQFLAEDETITLPEVRKLKDLKDPKTGKYYTGEVNVTGNVMLIDKKLKQFPVKFGAVSGSFSCNQNVLTSLEGAPHTIGGYFSCFDNQLISLEGIHKIIKKMNGIFYCGKNPIKSGGIGLLLIEGLTIIGKARLHPAFEIIEKYLGQGKKGLLYCQDELIEAGYEEYARL